MQVIKDTYEWLTVAYGNEFIPRNKANWMVRRTIVPLLKEELRELATAIYHNDKKEQLNAIADLMVVITNMPFVLGYPLHEVLDAKVDSLEYRFKIEVDLLCGTKILSRSISEFANEYILKYVYGQDVDNKKEIMNIAITLFVIKSIGINLGFTEKEIEEECRKTFLSNMTKFCRTEEDAIRTVEAYKNGTHPNKLGVVIDATYKPTGHPEFKYRIERVSDKKLLKAITFQDVDQF